MPSSCECCICRSSTGFACSCKAASRRLDRIAFQSEPACLGSAFGTILRQNTRPFRSPDRPPGSEPRWADQLDMRRARCAGWSGKRATRLSESTALRIYLHRMFTSRCAAFSTSGSSAFGECFRRSKYDKDQAPCRQAASHRVRMTETLSILLRLCSCGRRAH